MFMYMHDVHISVLGLQVVQLVLGELHTARVGAYPASAEQGVSRGQARPRFNAAFHTASKELGANQRPARCRAQQSAAAAAERPYHDRSGPVWLRTVWLRDSEACQRVARSGSLSRSRCRRPMAAGSSWLSRRLPAFWIEQSCWRRFGRHPLSYGGPN
eukprot:206326-Chlamydomonas_euryale.AAC.6